MSIDKKGEEEGLCFFLHIDPLRDIYQGSKQLILVEVVVPTYLNPEEQQRLLVPYDVIRLFQATIKMYHPVTRKRSAIVNKVTNNFFCHFK